MSQVCQESGTSSFATAPEAMLVAMYVGAGSRELDHLFGLMILAGKASHVLLVLWAACTFCAELLLKEDEEESCLYVYVASNYVLTDRVLVQETFDDGVLESLLMLLNLGHSCLLQCMLIRKRCCMVTWDFSHVDMCNMHVPLQTCMFEKKTM